MLSPFDLKRLESYANNMLDFHVVMDLLPTVAQFYFEKRLGTETRLSAVQSSILLALGLQRKTIEDIETELQLPVSQALALFTKVIRKISKRLLDIQKAAVSASIPEPLSLTRQPAADGDDAVGGITITAKGQSATDWKPVGTSLRDELKEAGDEVTKQLREKQREMIDALDLSKYAIHDNSADWTTAESQVTKIATGNAKSTLVSVKSSAPSGGQKRKAGDDESSVGRKSEKDKKGSSRRSIKKTKR